MKKVSVGQFEAEIKTDSKAQFLDVREPAEYAQVHLAGFELCPLSQLTEKTVRNFDKDKTTYLLCRSGNRACSAGERLEKMGFLDLRVIDGGLQAFEHAGKSLSYGGSPVWSLERQVRFAAGFLIILGIAIAKFLHPGGWFLTLFVAGGLIFSAVTDTCGMAMFLAKMPWNQKAAK